MTTWVKGAIAVSLIFAMTGSGEEVKPMKLAICCGPGKGDLVRFKDYLESRYHITCTFVEAEKAKKATKDADFTPTPVTNLKALLNVDVILSNFYRTWAPKDELALLKKAFTSQPVVGLRKAHHGFQNWLQADQEVFGMSYKGHYFAKKGKQVKLFLHEEKKFHPLVKGLKPIMPAGGLYRHLNPAPGVVPLMMGGPEDKEMVPQMWLRQNRKSGQRVLYTRYDPKDLSNEGVRDMVIRALAWAAKRDLVRLKK